MIVLLYVSRLLMTIRLWIGPDAVACVRPLAAARLFPTGAGLAVWFNDFPINRGFTVHGTNDRPPPLRGLAIILPALHPEAPAPVKRLFLRLALFFC
jgi:hypothetical protein